jgi:hypothetical protein
MFDVDGNIFCFKSGFVSIVVLAIALTTAEVKALAVGATPVNQTLALQHLYDATNGPEWSSNGGDPWNFSQPLELTEPCNGWDGITCDCVNSTSITDGGSETCNIVELMLFWVDLKGSLPSTLSMLQHLSMLNLAFNEITGTIPLGTFNLTNLVDFNMGYNSLTGTIPHQVTQMTGLIQFNVFFNYFSGTIPTGIDSWAHLEVNCMDEIIMIL